MWRQTNTFSDDEIQLAKNDENWIIELNIEHLYVLIYIYKASEMKIGILKKESLKFLTVTTWPLCIRKNLVDTKPMAGEIFHRIF